MSSSSTQRTSRYLRAAPRPNEWEDMEDGVLARLGSNAEQSLQSTLQQLRDKYNWQPKKGPGRKSNAEHAIHFYEYLLEKVRKDNKKRKAADAEEEEEQSQSNHSRSEASSPATMSARTSDTNNNIDDEETESEMEGSSSKVSSSQQNNIENMEEDQGDAAVAVAVAVGGNEEDPNNNEAEEPTSLDEKTLHEPDEAQHDKCDVCYEEEDPEHPRRKEFLKCTTCPQVFHWECSRPVLEEFPSDTSDWRCAYCVLASEPKNTRNRRISASAVRLMARLRNGLKRRRSKERKQQAPPTLQPQPKPPPPQVKAEVSATKEKDAATTTETTNVKVEAAPEEGEPELNVAAKDTSKENAGEEVKSGEHVQEKDLKKDPGEDSEQLKEEDVKKDPEEGEDKHPHEGQEKEPGDEKVKDSGVVEDLAKKDDNDKAEAMVIDEQDASKEEEDKKLPAVENDGDEEADKKLLPAEGYKAEKDDDEEEKDDEAEEETEDEAEADDEKTGNDEEEEQELEDVADDGEESEAQEDDKSDAGEAYEESEDGGEDEKPEAKPSESQEKEDNVVGTSDAKTTPSTKEQAASANSSSGASSPKRRNIELSMLTDVWAGQIESPDDGIGRRNRKQPNLYNPQLVSDRKWKSDEVEPSDGETESEEGSKKKTEGGDDDAAKTGKKQGSGETKGSGEVKCHFCADDPSIPLCCFCACRSCMGKRDKDKVLVCSECSDLYHWYCLNPPLSAKPADDKPWRCPSCTRDKTAKPAPRTPPKNKSGSKAAAARQSPPRSKRPVGRPPSSSKTASAQKKRPVGRPPKSKSRSPSPSRKSSRTPTATIATASAVAEPPVKRKRGRPPKTAKAIAAAAAAAAAEAAAKKSATGRKRGRPPKVKVEEIQPPPRKKPLRSPDGRFISPPKDSKKSGSKEKTAPTPLSQTSSGFVVSRSGRTVKRSSFHDELPEGEQHLKSHRLGGAFGAQTTKKSQSAIKKPPPVQRSSAKQAPAARARAAAADNDAEDVVMGDPMEVDEAVPASLADETIPPQAETPQAFSAVELTSSTRRASYPPTAQAAASAAATSDLDSSNRGSSRGPRRKPGARECMQISRRFGVGVIPKKYIDILTDYCNRGKVEHLVRMRSRLDEHSQFLESQLAGLEALIKAKGESEVVVPALPEQPDRRLDRTFGGEE